jgi:ribosomal protein L12E/L44/L45/RPP1/RPP2|nr:MAG TPA: Scaffold protein [Microviridae sp.]
MNKRYEEGRKPFFSNSGEKLRKQYVWGKDEKGNQKLIETEPIDIQGEIESYADECDIKNIVRKASFDPEFAKSLVDSAKTDEVMDITEWPTNIHEYHAMMATAQANAMELQRMQKKAAEETKKQEENNEPE